MAQAPVSSAEDRPLAAWRLTRHCAVSPRAYVRHVAVVCAFLLAIALGFLALGSAVVALFFVLQACAVAGLHLLHAVHATDGEKVVLYRDRLVLFSFRGLRTRMHVFPACWVRLEKGRGRDEGAYWICYGARRLPLGRHLPLVKRRRTVAEIARALQNPPSHAADTQCAPLAASPPPAPPICGRAIQTSGISSRNKIADT
jgi:uncharacterized membrane protein